MQKIESINNVREFPDDGNNHQTMIIKNHSNYRDIVVIELEGKSYTFCADHIRKALDNATNCR
ncbi:hypothetical protein [uncultured Methylophaga sp.]|uniref:hypothetical protein n=1 Tax=uncultured Methylophaga sp. TaxID=285271 RepID=UPI0030F4DD26